MLTGFLPFKVGKHEKLVRMIFNEQSLTYELRTYRTWDGASITRTWKTVDGNNLSVSVTYPIKSKRKK